MFYNPGSRQRIGIFYSHRCRIAGGVFTLIFFENIFCWRLMKSGFPVSPFPQKSLKIENQCFNTFEPWGNWGNWGQMGKWGNGETKKRCRQNFFSKKN